MTNDKTQTAKADDGTPKGMPTGQKSEIDPMNNPTAMSGVKEGRHTGKNAAGTDFLRRNQNGFDQEGFKK